MPVKIALFVSGTPHIVFQVKNRERKASFPFPFSPSPPPPVFLTLLASLFLSFCFFLLFFSVQCFLSSSLGIEVLFVVWLFCLSLESHLLPPLARIFSFSLFPEGAQFSAPPVLGNLLVFGFFFFSFVSVDGRVPSLTRAFGQDFHCSQELFFFFPTV